MVGGVVFAGLLPRWVSVVEEEAIVSEPDPPGSLEPGSLAPAERRLVAGAGQVRRQEFSTGRACAHRALAVLGRPVAAIEAGPSGEPLWPPGVVGSITHCAGYVAAAVAEDGALRSIGIDAECNVVLDEAVRRRVLAPGEHLRGAAGVADPALLAFSAKEAAFKAWYPLTRAWLEFDQAAVTVDGHHFSVEVLAPRRVGDEAPTTYAGRWVATRSHVFCAVVVPVVGARAQGAARQEG